MSRIFQTFNWGSSFRAFQHPNFQLFFWGQLVSVIGVWMASTALQWLVYRLIGSQTCLGLVTFIIFLPVLLFSLYISVILELIQPEWIQVIAGQNTVAGNFVGVIFGVVMYFPTLMEVPTARMFLELGMHRCPLLAYLISDSELSLQSILITVSIIGRKKAWVYVFWVSLFSTLARLLYGSWVNGTRLFFVGFYLVGILGFLGIGAWIYNQRNNREPAVAAGENPNN